jgi:UDP-N-acetylglucosamine 2-epimerase (non-hydrolysing)
MCFVGNVMIDSLLANRELAHPPAVTCRAGRDAALLDDLNGYGLVTLHRPSNVDHARRCSRCWRCCVKFPEALPLGLCPASADACQR